MPTDEGLDFYSCYEEQIDMDRQTEQTQTEKLRETLAKLILRQDKIISEGDIDRAWDKLTMPEAVSYLSDANYFLQACKEAGLKFVLPAITSDPEIGNERVEEIEIDTNR